MLISLLPRVSVWALTLFAFEGFVAVYFPLWESIRLTLCNIKKILLCVLCLPVVSGAVIAILLYDTVVYGDKKFCLIKQGYGQILMWSMSISYSLLPFLIMAVCNIAIVK